MNKTRTPQSSNVQANVDDQTHTISDLIDQYVAKKQLLIDVLNSEAADSERKIPNAEADVDTAFKALLSADLQHNHEICTRTHFLIREIREALDAGSIHDEMAQTIERDVNKINRLH